jgi:hypothetical protein
MPPPNARSGTWGRNLLAGVGVTLVVIGSLLIGLPFVTKTSGFNALPGVGALALGVLLVVLSAYYESSGGSASVPGYSVRFGRRREETAPDGEADRW